MSDDTDAEAFAERLAAVERAVTDGAAAPADRSDAADAEARLDAVESRLADLDDRVTELEAAAQALRGYVGGVRAVNRDVERRADLALARTERLASDAGGDASTGDGAPAAPDDTDALDARTPDPETLAGTGSGDAPEGDGERGSGPAGIADRLRDAL